MGRPTKYSAEMSASLTKWISEGSTYTDVCRMGGIDYSTFLDWQEKYPEFSKALSYADAICKHKRISTILAAEKKSWQAAAWFLERRFSVEYGSKSFHEVNHSITSGVENALSVVGALVEAAQGANKKSKRILK